MYAVSRGILGLSVACARCHDHKFDPIPTKDYYGLMGVFASTMRAERPMMDVDPKVEERYLDLPGMTPRAEFRVPFPGGSNRRQIVSNIVIAAVTTGVIWLLFSVLLRLHLYPGVLFGGAL